MKIEVKQKLSDIINYLPDNLTISKDVLKYLNNNTTKIVLDEDIKGNYYLFFNDTIYITNNNLKNDMKYCRLTVICHECIHSIQSKLIHFINFILSNIELILFFVSLILKLLNLFEVTIDILYTLFCLSCLIPRIILETDAINRSFSLTNIFLEKYNASKEDINYFYNYLKKKKFICKIGNIFNFSIWKIIRLIIIIFLV